MTTLHPFVQEVQKTLTAQQLLKKGDRVLIGVSGGADSMALLHALVALRPSLRLKLAIAHLDHGLRASSDVDARFVENAARVLKIPAFIERWQVCELCERQGWSLEEGARKLRYQFLEGVAAQFSAGTVAVAHTADDQAETVLMRLLRGSGLAGLSAIPLKRELGQTTLIRPFLPLWRSDVTAYLKSVNASYRDDESNKDMRFLRNRIRHELIPSLQQAFNPRLKEALVQLAGQAQADGEYLQKAAARQWKRATKPCVKNQVIFRISALRRQPVSLQRQLVRKAIRSVKGDLRAFEFRHWKEIESLIQDRPVGSIVHLPGITATKQSKAELMLAPDAVQGYTDGLSRSSTITLDVTKG